MSNHIAALQQASNDLGALSVALKEVLYSGKPITQTAAGVTAARQRAQSSLNHANVELSAFNVELAARQAELDAILERSRQRQCEIAHRAEMNRQFAELDRTIERIRSE